MKKTILLLLLLGLFACNNTDNNEVVISMLKKQHIEDSIQLNECNGINHTILKQNDDLTVDTMCLKMYIDSLEYTYTKKHNDYYYHLLWSERMNKIFVYQEKIDKLQMEMDSIAKLN